MHFSSATIAAMAAFGLARTTTAQIFLGQATLATEPFHQVIAAWPEGQQNQQMTRLSTYPESPCNIEFSVNGAAGLKLQGCGSPSLWVEQNSVFRNVCEFAPGDTTCSDRACSQQQWRC